MFENPGKKLKIIALIVFVLMILVSIVYALHLGQDEWILFFVVLIVGFIIAYLSVILLYALGDLIEDVGIIRSILQAQQQRESFGSTGNTGSANSHRMPSANEWKCQCGRINANYVYTCACGVSKPKPENRP